MGWTVTRFQDVTEKVNRSKVRARKVLSWKERRKLQGRSKQQRQGDTFIFVSLTTINEVNGAMIKYEGPNIMML